jgi:ribosomal protein S18 acetylase RimI-like enzyme
LWLDAHVSSAIRATAFLRNSATGIRHLPEAIGDQCVENPQILCEPFIDEGTRQFIVNGLDYYNIATTGFADYFPVNFVLRGERNDVLGECWGGWLHVTVLWVSEAARGSGHGRRLMENAESYARARGAVGATLETYSFQARPFYERLGYQVCGTVDGYPPGHVNYLLKKVFA